MNLIKRVFVVIGIVFCLVMPVAILNSCTSAQQQSAVVVEYQTLSAVVNVVDVAHGVYNTLFAAGKISADLDAKVAKAYADYQSYANLAITTAKAQQSAANAGTVNAYIPLLENAVNTLIGLFNQANPPTPTPAVSISRMAGV